MDARTALERLDAVRPDSDDLSLPELAAASSVLASDAAVAAEHRRRQLWDRAIASSMHDVPVPAGAKERLLARLTEASEHSEPDVVTTPRTPSRRRFLGALSAVAASAVAAGLYWVVVANAIEPVTVADLQNAAAALAAGKVEPEAFHGEFQPTLPAGSWQNLPASRAMGLLEVDGRHRAAAWQFTYGRKRSRGILVAIPVADVSNLPATKPDYVGGNAIAWTGGEFVYVCRVDGPIDDLLRLLDDERLA